MKQIIIIILFIPAATSLYSQDSLDLIRSISSENGTLIIKSSSDCRNNCFGSLSDLKAQIIDLSFRKKYGEKEIKTCFPIRVGNSLCSMTTYNYFLGKSRAASVICFENDSVILHDVGADGVLSDSSSEYCISKITHARLNWETWYRFFVDQISCPINCFVDRLRALGYRGIGKQESLSGSVEFYFIKIKPQ
jgi:hypothetical protein